MLESHRRYFCNVCFQLESGTFGTLSLKEKLGSNEIGWEGCRPRRPLGQRPRFFNKNKVFPAHGSVFAEN